MVGRFVLGALAAALVATGAGCELPPIELGCSGPECCDEGTAYCGDHSYTFSAEAVCCGPGELCCEYDGVDGPMPSCCSTTDTGCYDCRAVY